MPVNNFEQRLISLEYELRLTEYRLRRDLIERDLAGLDRITTAMSLICRMLAAITTVPQRQRPGVSRGSGAEEQRAQPDESGGPERQHPLE